MQRNTKIFLLVGGLSLLVTAFLLHQKILLEKTGFSLKKFRIKNYSVNDATVEMVFKINNLSNIDFSVKGYNLRIYLNGEEIANPQSNQKITIKANGSSDVSLDLRFNPEQVKDLALNFFAGVNFKSNTLLSIKGRMNVGALKDTITTGFIPVNYSVKLSELM